MMQIIASACLAKTSPLQPCLRANTKGCVCSKKLKLPSMPMGLKCYKHITMA